jgi:nucleoside-diphosphate-sugar epimerase
MPIMSNITIIGAGWLGLPLSKKLIELNHQVMATCRSQSRSNTLAIHHIAHSQFDLANPEKPLKELLTQFSCDTVIGCFPPGFRQGNGLDYALQWQYIVQQCQAAGVTKLMMISSTAVYPDQPELMYEEDANLSLATKDERFSEKAKILLAAEQHVIESGIHYSILRCSGLIGPDRHPARFVNKLKQVSRLAPANILHLTDAIGAIIFALDNLTDTVVNVTTPTTVSKAEFYQVALDSIHSSEHLPPIVEQPDKCIISDKLVHLGYEFHFKHTLEALLH